MNGIEKVEGKEKCKCETENIFKRGELTGDKIITECPFCFKSESIEFTGGAIDKNGSPWDLNPATDGNVYLPTDKPLKIEPMNEIETHPTESGTLKNN